MKKMRKKDLRSGHFVQDREGVDYIVLLNAETSEGYKDILVDISGDGFQELDDFNDDLTFEDSDYFEFDIVKVSSGRSVIEWRTNIVEKRPINWAWERKATKLTVQEVSKRLGYEVEIVFENPEASAQENNNVKDRVPQIKVGDLVQIKEWEELSEEYGYDHYGNIQMESGDESGLVFHKNMAGLCGSTFTVNKILNNKNYKEVEGHYFEWVITTDMVKVIEESKND